MGHQEHNHHICDPSGMNMTMFMDGFHSIIIDGFSSNSSPKPCINLFFSSWTITSKSQLLLAMLGLFILGTITESLSVARLTFAGNTNHDIVSVRRKTAIVCIHGLQAFLGYFLMLGAMTFSIELLFSVCMGLASGYFFFSVRTQK